VAQVEERAAAAAAERTRADELAAKLAAQSNARDADGKLITELRAKLDARDGEVAGGAGGVTVSLVDEILFPSGESALSPRGQEVLKKLGAVLKPLTDRQILIGGHTDDRPIHTPVFPSNWELSTARAVSVVRYLADEVGVDPRRLAAAGYSQYHPRGKNRAKNRRIEILLAPVTTVKR
jgi:chemotaxis protein MotB